MEEILTDTTEFQKVLEKTIKGYHVVNECPIKEATWEAILCQVLTKLGKKYTYKSGSHQPGKDIAFEGKNGLSCKSCKETKDKLVLSSYRMTGCKTVEECIEEIDIKRANFEYYVVLSRIENSKQNMITYNCYVIPSSKIKASNNNWTTKTDKNTSELSGWESDEKDGVSFSIRKSMSNQLWINVDKKAFHEHCVCSNIQVNNKNEIDYCSLFEMLSVKEEPSSSTEDSCVSTSEV